MRNPYTVSCSVPELDDLAVEVEPGSHHSGVTDPVGRAKLRADLDGIVAHIYGLSEDVCVYLLSAFPLVAEPFKEAALAAYCDVDHGKET